MATKQDYEFTDVIPEDCLCIICMDVLQEPQLTDCCGQHFCKACLEKSLQTTASHRETQTGGLQAGRMCGQTTTSHREVQTGGLRAGRQGIGLQYSGLSSTSSQLGGLSSTMPQFEGLTSMSSQLGGFSTASSKFGGFPSTSSQLGGFSTASSQLGGFSTASSQLGGFPSTSSQLGGPGLSDIPAQMGVLYVGGQSAKRVSKQCPHCRTNNFKYMINLPLARKIKDLKVYCPNKGCNHMIRLGDVESHKQKCGFLSVKCINSCGMTILSKDLQFHCQNKCSKRKVSCQHCGQSGTHEAITSQTHTSSCPEVPLRCDNLCGALKMKRKNMSRHKQICPEEMVSCTFAEAGCTVTTKRKDLDSHVTANVQQHLSLLMTAYMSIKQELQSLKKGTCLIYFY